MRISTKTKRSVSKSNIIIQKGEGRRGQCKQRVIKVGESEKPINPLFYSCQPKVNKKGKVCRVYVKLSSKETINEISSGQLTLTDIKDKKFSINSNGNFWCNYKDMEHVTQQIYDHCKKNGIYFKN